MGRVVAEQVGLSDVVRIGGARGKKAVVTERARLDSGIGLYFRTLVGGDSPVISSGFAGYISLRSGERIERLGRWVGHATPGSRGRIVNDAGEDPQKGSEPTMATTKKRPAKKTGAAAKKTTGNGESTRASAEQLDKDAARVVDLRDNKGKSWGEIEETTGINASRLRALYNRGGGQPSGARAKSANKGAAGKKPAGKRAPAKKKANPSAKG